MKTEVITHENSKTIIMMDIENLKMIITISFDTLKNENQNEHDS